VLIAASDWLAEQRVAAADVKGTKMLRSIISKISPCRRVAVLASACSALALLGTAGTASAISCSNATLNGTYAFATISWSPSAGGPPVPVSLAGFDNFNGKGTGTGVITVVALSGIINNNTPYTSIYTVNADCTGTIVYNTAGAFSHFNLYVTPSGNQVSVIQTDTGSVSTEVETRVSTQN
jgi:hypothetical protein